MEASENPKDFCKCVYFNLSSQAYKEKRQKFSSCNNKCIPYVRLQLN